jgi:hypothetical protein
MARQQAPPELGHAPQGTQHPAERLPAEADPDILRARMAAHGLLPEDLMKDGALIFNKETEKDLLLFLNEDLWTGDFSGDQYAAARKARR